MVDGWNSWIEIKLFLNITWEISSRHSAVLLRSISLIKGKYVLLRKTKFLFFLLFLLSLLSLYKKNNKLLNQIWTLLIFPLKFQKSLNSQNCQSTQCLSQLSQNCSKDINIMLKNLKTCIQIKTQDIISEGSAQRSMRKTILRIKNILTL